MLGKLGGGAKPPGSSPATGKPAKAGMGALGGGLLGAGAGLIGGAVLNHEWNEHKPGHKQHHSQSYSSGYGGGGGSYYGAPSVVQETVVIEQPGVVQDNVYGTCSCWIFVARGCLLTVF